MPKESEKAFENRSKNFFKANSKVIQASGFNVNTMQSEVGFYENKLKNQSTNYAVKDLEQQENGGKISGKSFIPLNKARSGNSPTRNVKKGFRLNDVIKGNVIDVKKNKAKSKKQQYIRSAIYAKMKFGNDAFLLGNTFKGGNRTLSRIDSVSSDIKTKKLQVKRTPLYTYRKGRKITVAGTNFMERAAHESSLIMDKQFTIQAIKQFKKHGLVN
jgi:hypothetical protein